MAASRCSWTGRVRGGRARRGLRGGGPGSARSVGDGGAGGSARRPGRDRKLRVGGVEIILNRTSVACRRDGRILFPVGARRRPSSRRVVVGWAGKM